MDIGIETFTRQVNIEVVDGLAGVIIPEQPATPAHVYGRGDKVSYLKEGSEIAREWIVAWAGPCRYNPGKTALMLKPRLSAPFKFYITSDKVKLVKARKMAA